jgi:hypothetical protein
MSTRLPRRRLAALSAGLTLLVGATAAAVNALPAQAALPATPADLTFTSGQPSDFVNIDWIRFRR